MRTLPRRGTVGTALECALACSRTCLGLGARASSFGTVCFGAVSTSLSPPVPFRVLTLPVWSFLVVCSLLVLLCWLSHSSLLKAFLRSQPVAWLSWKPGGYAMRSHR